MVQTIWQLEGEIVRSRRRAVRHVVVCLLLAGISAWLNPWPGYYLWSLSLLLLACGGRSKYRTEVAFLRADYRQTLTERQQERDEDAEAKSRETA